MGNDNGNRRRILTLLSGEYCQALFDGGNGGTNGISIGLRISQENESCSLRLQLIDFLSEFRHCIPVTKLYSYGLFRLCFLFPSLSVCVFNVRMG